MGATTSKSRTRKPQQRQDEALVRAVLHVRISDDPEGTEKGVDRQETDCCAYAQAHGMTVVDGFRENDTSAFKQRTIVLPSGEKVRRVIRPRFRAMLRLLARREADVMVTYDLDRAVRDPRDLEDLIDSKVLYGFRVASTTGSLRLDSDSDIAMARVLAAMANKSSADTARRGRPPTGYSSGNRCMRSAGCSTRAGTAPGTGSCGRTPRYGKSCATPL